MHTHPCSSPPSLQRTYNPHAHTKTSAEGGVRALLLVYHKGAVFPPPLHGEAVVRPWDRWRLHKGTGSPGGGLEVLACLEGCLSPHRALNSLVKFISYIPKVMGWAWLECLCIKRIPSPQSRGAERIPDTTSCKDTMSPQHTQ